jgi:hypothetical protein
MHAQSKQFVCLNFLSVKHNWKLKKQTFFVVSKAKISRQINDIRDTGPDTENTDHGPDMGFYGPLVNQSEQRILKSHIITYLIASF